MWSLAYLRFWLVKSLIQINPLARYALIADVNPPEHRGTVYSLGNLVNGVGRGVVDSDDEPDAAQGLGEGAWAVSLGLAHPSNGTALRDRGRPAAVR